MRWLLGMLLVLYSLELATPAKLPPAPPQPRYSDVTCLAWVINDEARGEPLQGRRAVYDVVKHRMKVRHKTACEVIAEPYQFSGYKAGAFENINQKMLEDYWKVKKTRPVVPTASYFHADYVQPTWASKMKRLLTVGKHIFYTNKEKQE